MEASRGRYWIVPQYLANVRPPPLGPSTGTLRAAGARLGRLEAAGPLSGGRPLFK